MQARQFLKNNKDENYVQALVRKWSPLLEGIGADHTRNVMAVLYENQSQYLQGMNEETRTTNVGSFLKFVFPVLRRVWPKHVSLAA